MTKRNLNYWSWKPGDLLLWKYRVLQVLEGSLWRVLIVEDNDEKTKYAVKTFKNDYIWEEEAYDRFKKASDVWVGLGKVKHMAQAHFTILVDGLPCLFVEYLEAVSLADMIGLEEFTHDTALDFSLQFCTAMDEIYRKSGLVHKDISPGNIFVTGEKGVKVMDIGLTRVFDSLEVPESWKKEKDLSAYNYKLTRTGYGLFMPLYVPRELETNKAFTDIRSDIFSFGVLLVEMLCVRHKRGSPEWSGLMKSLYETLRKPEYRVEQFPGVAELAPPLQALLARALAKNLDDRYENFSTLKDELLAIYEAQTGRAWKEPEEEVAFDQDEWGKKGRAYLGSGDLAEALKCFNAALELNPEDGNLWSEKGKVLFYLKKYNDSIKCFSKSLHKDPASKDNWLFLGNALAELGRKSDAIECYNKVLSLDPEDSDTWKKKGMALSLLGSHREAIECFDHALAREPGSYQTWKQKALSLLPLKMYKDALKSLVKAIELNPEDAENWNSSGKVLEFLSRREDALDAYDKALKLNPRLSEAWCNKGMIQRLLGRYNEAINSFNNAIVEKPRYEDAWEHKGEALMMLGRAYEAMECFNIVLDINPRRAGAWSNKGMLLRQGGKSSEAAECFSKALAINPSDIKAMQGLRGY